MFLLNVSQKAFSTHNLSYFPLLVLQRVCKFFINISTKLSSTISYHSLDIFSFWSIIIFIIYLPSCQSSHPKVEAIVMTWLPGLVIGPSHLIKLSNLVIQHDTQFYLRNFTKLWFQFISNCHHLQIYYPKFNYIISCKISKTLSLQTC